MAQFAVPFAIKIETSEYQDTFKFVCNIS